MWTPTQLIDATHGRWLTEPAGGSGVSTDTRTIEPGDIFIALKGDHFDGHDFLDVACRRGASVVIISDERQAQSAVLLVPDTLEALQNLARAHRRRLREASVSVIAVTGSNGKTTTRSLIATVLSAHRQRGRGTESLKSYNNHIGVPLTLLAASTEDDFVVVEVGTNHPGEIAHLAEIVHPDAAVITNIGSAHIGMFGSRSAVADEKKMLLGYGSLAVVPDDPLLADVPAVRIGIDLHCAAYDPGAFDEPMRFTVACGGTTCDVALPLHGKHNITNALDAIAVGMWYGMTLEATCAALSDAQAVAMRSEVRTFGAITVINDAYNANPESVCAALDLLAAAPPARPGGRRIAILGDMFELGEAGPEAHRRIGRRLGELSGKIDVAVVIGKLSMFTAEALTRTWPADRILAYAAWDDALPAKVASLLRGGDVVLLKASRGMALERILEAIGDSPTHDSP